MEKPPNNFEEGPESLENEFEEYEDLIKHYEDLNTQEALKEKVECAPHVEEFEEMLVPLLKKELLEALNNIETEEEARNSEERASVKEALVPLVEKMHFLKNRTDITEEEYDKLHKKYKIISNATGFINNGIVDHDR
jgi:hypothetical protein